MNKLFTIFALAALVASASAFECTKEQTSSGCRSCTDANKCTCSSEAYVIDTKCELCSKKMEGCYSCSSSAACTTCKSGYFMKKNNTCGKCSRDIENCTACNLSDTLQCTECIDGFFANEKKCVFSSKLAFAVILSFVAALLF